MSKESEADVVVDKLSDLFPSSADLSTEQVVAQSQHESEGGNLGVRKIDDTDTKQSDIQYLRVPDMGSVECYQLDDGTWAVTRRDKLPHNKEDKL
jgi:hypothetical protein